MNDRLQATIFGARDLVTGDRQGRSNDTFALTTGLIIRCKLGAFFAALSLPLVDAMFTTAQKNTEPTTARIVDTRPLRAEKP